MGRTTNLIRDFLRPLVTPVAYWCGIGKTTIAKNDAEKGCPFIVVGLIEGISVEASLGGKIVGKKDHRHYVASFTPMELKRAVERTVENEHNVPDELKGMIYDARKR